MKRFCTFLLFLFFVAGWTILSFSIQSDTGNPSQDSQRTLASESLKKSLEKGEPNLEEIKSLLITHQYQELENQYEMMLKHYKNDVEYESYLNKAYELFNSENNIAVSELDSWVEQTGSYIAYTARGIFKAQKGFQIRGGESIHDTPVNQLDEMIQYHKDAADDLLLAVNKNSTNMPAYVWLVSIGKASSMSFTPRQILEKAIENDPRSFYLRSKYMESLTPKWGGSYEDMANFIEELKGVFSLNPRLWALQGEVDAYKAEEYWRKKDYRTAVEFYSSALKYGDRIVWLEGRAACYYGDGQLKNSFNDYNRILYYQPSNSTAIKWSSYLRSRLGF
jgi:tetratricopeptide (TPR) repeat protein